MQYVPELTLLILLYVVEHYYPFAAAASNRDQHASVNMVLYFINLCIAYVAGLWLARTVWGYASPAGFFQYLSAPWWVMGVLAFLVFDGWMYLLHRASHAIPFLWRFHRVHHTDEHVDVTTAWRHHGGEQIIEIFSQFIIIPITGITVGQLFVYATVSRLVVLFHHSNIALPEKWDRLLRMIIVSPGMHRIHHSSLRLETDSNYSTVFSFWDRWFKTLRLRSDPGSLQYGLSEFRLPLWQTLRGALILPLVTMQRPALSAQKSLENNI